jgi:spore germination protein
MNKKLGLFMLVLLGVVGFTLFKPGLKNKTVASPSPNDLLKSNNQTMNYSAWIPDYEQKKGLESLKMPGLHLNIISPVWYIISKNNGDVVESDTSLQDDIIATAKASNSQVVPTLFNEFETARLKKIFTDQKFQDAQIDTLIAIANEFEYKGWDLDFERLTEKDKDNYSQFIKNLANKLHKNNLLLSVTVQARTGTSKDWDEAKGFDYRAIGENADIVRVMAYDFHNEQSSPGPITPFSDLKEVLNYATSQIPKEKIVLGLPTYGYDWGKPNQRAKSLTYQDALQILKTQQVQAKRDEPSYALFATYKDGENVKHTVWFEDAKSIQSKIEIAKSYDINNFCFWHLGGEDPQIWNNL